MKLTETADTSDVCTVPERAAVTYEVVPWASPDCAELRGKDASVDAWCAAHEDWVDTAVAPPYQCSDGSSPQPPTKIRSRPITTPEPPWGPWQIATVPCPDDPPPPEDQLRDEVERAMASLEIKAAPALIAPVSEWFAVQIPMTFYTKAPSQIFRVELLGSDIELEVVAERFSWNFGDGSEPLVTTLPGARYPDQTVTHTYTRKGSWSATLTTTWRGRFRVVGTSSWQDVQGRATTTHSAASIELREIRSVLS